MEPYRKHSKEHRRGGGDIAGIVVEETDGSPSVKNVTKIKVAVGDLTDNLDGSVTIGTGGAAGGAHALTDVNNTVSGRTAGDLLIATAATTYSFAQMSGDATMNGTGGVTVAATHSGSTHQAATTTHEAAADPHAGYVLESLIDAAGDLLYGSADNTPARLAIGTAAYKLHVASGLPAWTKDYVPIWFIIDGGGATITTGQKGRLPYLLENLTCEGWTITADQSGSIVVDIWSDTYANFPATVADTIAGTEKPTLSTAQKNQDVSLSSFDTTLDAGNHLVWNVDSVTSVQRVEILLHCYRR